MDPDLKHVRYLGYSKSIHGPCKPLFSKLQHISTSLGLVKNTDENTDVGDSPADLGFTREAAFWPASQVIQMQGAILQEAVP
jgi:hypothetical protein